MTDTPAHAAVLTVEYLHALLCEYYATRKQLRAFRDASEHASTLYVASDDDELSITIEGDLQQLIDFHLQTIHDAAIQKLRGAVSALTFTSTPEF